jgi:hypothetical protein
MTGIISADKSHVMPLIFLRQHSLGSSAVPWPLFPSFLYFISGFECFYVMNNKSSPTYLLFSFKMQNTEYKVWGRSREG